MRKLVLILLIIAFAFSVSFGATDPDAQKVRYKSLDLKWLKANGFWLTVNNFGQHGVDDGITDAGGYWAYQNGDAQYIYGAGMWFGAMIGTEKYVTSGYISSDGSSEFTPGEIGTSYMDSQYKVYLSSDGDWPLAEIKSVLDSYAVYHDANTNPPLQSAGNVHTPLNIEVVQKTYEWNYPSNNDIIFVIYEVTNEGTGTLTDSYLGIVQDPDVGNAVDDMVGYDATYNIGYCYDNDGTESFGHAGYIGYDFLDSPDDGGGSPIGLTAFKIFSIDVAPVNDVQRYNLMSGWNMAGDVYNPFDVDSGPADKRFMMTTGPFDLAPGETANIVLAIIPGYELGDDTTLEVTGTDGRSYRTLVGNSIAAQFIFDNEWLLPSAPVKPAAVAQSLDRKVFISWGSAAETTPDPYYVVASDPGSAVYDPDYIEYDFAGYRVYRAMSPAGPWTEIADFDLSSLQHSYLDTDVINGIPYYYKVVAYDAQPNPPESLESLGDTLFAQGRTNAVGYNPPVAPEPANGGAVVVGGNPGTITATIMEPNFVTGHTYRIMVEPGSHANELIYSVIDLDTSEYVAENFVAPNIGGTDKTYQTEIIDGVQYTISVVEYTYTFDSIATTSANAGEYDAAALTYVGDYGWTASMGTGHDLVMDFAATSTPGVFELTVLDADETAYAGENVYLEGITNGDRLAGGWLVTHWDLFGLNWSPRFEPGIDNCLFMDGYYLVLAEAYADDVYLEGGIVTELGAADGYEAATTMGIEPYFYAARFADEGEFRVTFHDSDVYEWAVTRNSGTSGSVSIHPDTDLTTAGPATEDLVVRGDALFDLPFFFLKDRTTGVLTPANVTTAVGTVYTVQNSGGTDAYYVDVPSIGYGDEFEINFTAAGVAHYATVEKWNGASWDLYGDYLPVALDGDNAFTLYGKTFNYADGVATTDPDYILTEEMTNGMYLYGTYDDGAGAAFDDGDRIYYTVYKAPIVDGTQITMQQHGDIISGGEYWEVDTYAMTQASEIDLSEVKVVPNPIYPINSWDQNVTSRKAEFTHLPGECDIYIYTVAGDIVRILHHDNGTGTEEWDVRNKDNQDLASGIYIYVIYVDDETKTEGTFAVIR